MKSIYKPMKIQALIAAVIASFILSLIPQHYYKIFFLST